MKKILLVTSLCFITCLYLTTVVFGGWGAEFKRAACERSCEEVYTKCMEAAGDAVDREGQGDFEGDIKYEAKHAACQERKDKCMAKCD